MGNGRDLEGKSGRFSSGRFGEQQEKVQAGTGEMATGNNFVVANPSMQQMGMQGARYIWQEDSLC